MTNEEIEALRKRSERLIVRSLRAPSTEATE